jgi:hypothetical protein
MNILFLAYRDWAIEVYPSVVNHPRTERVVLAKSTKEMLLELEKDTYDLILMCGWSEEPVKDVVERIPTFTAHCAADDKYSPGTPFQNQINDGVRFTKHRLVRVGYPELSLRQYSHEVDLDISGSTADIFLQLKATCIMLFNMFLYDYPNVDWRMWPVAQEQRKKRTPADSKLERGEFSRLDTRQLYDFIRGLEAPYPNAYLEDEVGKLFFSKVSFKKKDR